MKKLLAVGVIVLFLGVAIAPSINANISKTSIESEMVEFTTEVCGLGGGKRTITLNQEDASNLELLLEDIQLKLINVKSITEAKEIASDAIIELDKYGVLGDLSEKQVQRLILSGVSRQCISNRLINKYNNHLGFWNTNLFCLIGGYSKNVEFIRMSGYISMLIYILTLLTFPLYLKNPLKLLSVVSFGSNSWYFEGGSNTYYAKGLISSIGLLGIKCWIGEFKGNADEMSFQFYMGGWEKYIGIIGFTGIQITRIDQDDTFLLGSAIYVNMKQV